MNDQLDQIAKMLRAQLKSASHIWWIGGYVYGVTSNGDPFIILYPAAENLKEKVVRVYSQDFRKLPVYIKTDTDGGDTEANPNKDQARKKGIYHECPPFEIVTCDGRDTQMGKERRFGDVLRVSRAGLEALSGGQHRPPAPPPPLQPQPQPLQAPTASGSDILPDYRRMARAARTDTEFDYAAFMTLRNGMYSELERIKKVREVLVPDWTPGEQSNAAMLAALEVYRDKRNAAEKQGETLSDAHALARQEGRNKYNEETGR